MNRSPAPPTSTTSAPWPPSPPAAWTTATYREFVENHKTSISATVDLMLANKTLPLQDMTGADVDHIVKLAIEAHLRLAIYSE